MRNGEGKWIFEDFINLLIDRIDWCTPGKRSFGQLVEELKAFKLEEEKMENKKNFHYFDLWFSIRVLRLKLCREKRFMSTLLSEGGPLPTRLSAVHDLPSLPASTEV